MRAARVGCSGWSYRDWRGVLYPEGLASSRWLQHYASSFDTVEVNATFYRLPEKSTVRTWADQVPDGFLFAVKASRYLTHMRRLRGIKKGLDRFWTRLEPLRRSNKLGPVLWQLPERFECDEETLAATLAILPDASHCFEFRHASWFSPSVYELLEEHGASLVIAHDARRELPGASPTGPLVYLRLHYGSRGQDGNYSGRELTTWNRRIAAWRARRDVFAYLLAHDQVADRYWFSRAALSFSIARLSSSRSSRSLIAEVGWCQWVCLDASAAAGAYPWPDQQDEADQYANDAECIVDQDREDNSDDDKQ